MRGARVGVSGAILALALSACSGTPGYLVFDRPQTEKDALGPEFDVVDTSHLLPETVRYETTYDGIDLYLARTREGHFCLALASSWTAMTSCGGPGGPFGVSGPLGAFQVYPAPVPEEDGWLVLTDNIRVELPREKYVTTPGPAATPSP
ncbi:hypothetical protein M2152_000294 [Microbacteriaceae bacterium SG_E_30_P1]|uniref:Lipoprotein n=1 Tax=Antiquaquibacter oligotrophicus TaxID=2880260 RepID=A0ABT6KJE2_9MICO|nr:hypothetical protein [Antiquaquibacter oligotrophicus]MDH6180112.1 hypothetical protein [Antiquaquibacter oligotrophicus]UDF14137.1 hypothetical protein LH407_04570 [Antiquaquibacter oligotrophicus]